MGIGTSLVLIAVGAILRYAINDSVNSIDLPTVGLILMIVGVIGLAITLLMAFGRRDDGATVNRRDRY